MNPGFKVPLTTLITGNTTKLIIDNPFLRMNQNLQDYPQHHNDIDDIQMFKYGSWERIKAFNPKKGTTVTSTGPIPMEDNDQKYQHYDIQGESIYTNPPDKNIAYVDHGVEEDDIWSFPLSYYNSEIVKNEYMINPERAK